MVPPESEPRAQDADEGAADDVEAVMHEVCVSRCANVDCYADWE